jgi:hypothetical protein
VDRDDVLHSLYRIAEIVIVPSIYEPFSLVALAPIATLSGPDSSSIQTDSLRWNQQRREAFRWPQA